jgi:biotin-(acetyl-CoA carboxylase) ligase
MLRETASTQDHARAAGIEPGTVVVAWRQTAGRGRLGRAWADTGYTMLKRQSAQDPRKWVSLEPARPGASVAGTASK